MRNRMLVPVVVAALAAIGAWALNLQAADAPKPTTKPTTGAAASKPAAGETFAGPVETTQARKMPRIVVDGTRYNLKAGDNADAAAKETIAKISAGELTGVYVVTGQKNSTEGQPTILVHTITKK